jgi:RecB family exonuclease
LPLERYLALAAQQPLAHPMLQRYYHRLEHDWPRLRAGNELLQLKITLAGIPIQLTGTIDRLDHTSDGGILAILFRTQAGPLPSPTDLRQDHAMTIYHALVAANYPTKRPVRLQELWLPLDQSVTIELSEEEYRQQLSELREPIRDLARGQVRASPGLPCESCPFKQQGCPVYAHEQNPPDDLASAPPAGKMSPRKWIFKV